MRQIEVAVLNPEAVADAMKMMVCAARTCWGGHKIKTLDDFMALYEKGCTKKTLNTMLELPHPTLQKFGAINAVVVGASRRFLAQITRHQNEVKFMSASLQYSDYSDDADFVVPYEFLDNQELTDKYLASCKSAMDTYMDVVKSGVSNDAAGYAAPQGLRNVLIISATPYQWKHMICQRVCRRNTTETRYVMLRLWEQLYEINPTLFSPGTTGAFCMKGECLEGSMSCGDVIEQGCTPGQIIETDMPLLV